jgi:nicotinamidase-related amidase
MRDGHRIFDAAFPEERMREHLYPAETTALLIVNPYNDSLSEGGKRFEATRHVAATIGFYAKLRRLIPAVRAAEILVVIVPHARWRADDVDGRRYPTPAQRLADADRLYEEGSWGGAFHAEFGPKPGDVVAQEHRGLNGFVDTDLDWQLRRRGIEHVICVGVGANTCVEGTARHATELGYHVTLVIDATVAADIDSMRAAHMTNGPHYAHAILKTDEVIDGLPA